MAQRPRQLAVALLLVVGVELWLFHGNPFILRWWHWAAAGLVVAVSLSPLGARLGGMLERLRRPSPRAMRVVALAVAVGSAAAFYGLALYRNRPLVILFHDEGSYLIQAQMLAHGRLWMPEHPVAEAFETFHVFVKPVYASSYFPGTALMFVPGVWLGLPPWVTSLVLAGAMSGLLYLLVTRLTDGLCGLLAPLVLLPLPQVQNTATQALSHLAMALLGVSLVLAVLRWRDRKTAGRALLVGLIGGWAAITRPVDAIAWAAPAGVVMLIDLVRLRPAKWWITPLMLACGAAPLLAIQLTANRGITGSFWRTPMGEYIDRYHPGTRFGGGDEQALARRPDTALPQKLAYYDRYIRPMALDHRERNPVSQALDQRAGMLLSEGLPAMVLVLLLPVGLAGLTAGRAAMWFVLPLYLVLYRLYPIFLHHYVVVVAPGLAFMVLLGKHVAEHAWPRPRPAMTVALTALVLACVGSRLMETRRLESLMKLELWVMEFNGQLDALVQKPALVLYNLNTDGSGFHQEPVYNIDAAWPDDAAIVRAHNLDPQTTERLIRYYSSIGQDRSVYLADRLPDRPHYVGRVSELAARLARPASTTPQSSAQPLPSAQPQTSAQPQQAK